MELYYAVLYLESNDRLTPLWEDTLNYNFDDETPHEVQTITKSVSVLVNSTIRTEPFY